MPCYRLLYVEDNPVNALIVEELLRARPDIELAIEDTGAAGLWRAIEWQPHLLLLDHDLPDTTGPALLEALRAEGLTAPCALISARDADLPPGFDACWTKPLNFTAFLNGLARWLPERVSTTQESNPAP